jgi:probable rRNA maturation factor
VIEINNLTNIQINERFLRKMVQRVLRGEKTKREVNLSIALLEPDRIREINRRYRKENRVTDVLAFPELKKIKISPQKEIQNLGEIIICPAEVKKNAKKFNLTFKKELTKVLIHGILHLLGYNHEKGEDEAKKMEEKENYYLSQI